MSLDLNLETVCNHRIYREAVTLDSDRRSIRLSQPLASSNVDVFASDNKISSNLYSLVNDSDPLTLNTDKTRLIYFKSKWKSTLDYFEVSYNTLNSNCPKCVGLNVIDDISYNVKGDYVILRNEDLLIQNIEKFVITEKGSNALQPAIGDYLVQLLNQRISDGAYLTTKITQQINATLLSLKSMQDQYKASGRPVTKGELLREINNININVDKNDPEILRVDISATAQSGKPINFTQVMLRQIA